MDMNELDYLKPIEIADGIYWIGYLDEKASLHCNPYIIIDEGEAVLVDGGSRDDFSTVMLKILRLGINPQDINRLIYQHSDPDLCASIPQFEAIIDKKDLKIIAHKKEITFIRYYSSKTDMVGIDDLGYEYTFKSGRKLKFIETPFAHDPGSFMTYDVKTKTLFSSDIFGSFDKEWSLYKHLPKECIDCSPKEVCTYTKNPCVGKGVVEFHQSVMPSFNALKYALEQVKSLDIDLIAPQHGSLIDRESDKNAIIRHLESIKEVGFDYYMRRKQ